MPFRAILATLVAEHEPAVRAVVFCDEEGERVEAVTRDQDYDPYDLDLMGASYCAIARAIDQDFAALRIVHEEGVIHVHTLLRGYYVVALADRSAVNPSVCRTMSRISEALIEHM